MTLTPLILALTLGLAPAPVQEGSEGAEAFARQVFSLYEGDGPWPIDERMLDRLWTPEMAALIRRDRALATDDPPYLDADPVCNCQDAEDLTVTHVLIDRAPSGVSGRMATVAFTNGGGRETTVLLLQGGPGRWRIADVHGGGDHGPLRTALRRSNARIEAGGQALGRD